LKTTNIQYFRLIYGYSDKSCIILSKKVLSNKDRLKKSCVAIYH